jgi:hypothetical protein
MDIQTLNTSIRSENMLLSEPSIERYMEQCFICQEELGQPRPDGETEKAYILPCSHVFGHICISRWLDSSPNHNCPTCRRSMIYSCGHPIKPVESSKAPKCLDAFETLEKCILCRQEGIWKKRLELLMERQQMEERVLEGLKMFLPTLYGGMVFASRDTSTDERINESRERLRQDVECLRGELEKQEGIVSW